MKNDQYLKLEVSLFNTELVEQLVDRMGIEGWGIYVALLLKMRLNDDLTLSCSEPAVAAMARRWNTTPEEVMEVLCKSELFVQSDEDSERFSSPYLDHVMAALWIRRGDKLRAGRKPKCRTVNRSADGRFTVKPSIEEKSIEREEESYNSNTPTESPAAAATPLPPPIRPWQSLVDEMVTDTFWMELVGMRSGLGELYVEHRNKIVDLFRRHICLYDKGGGLLRLQDAKQYFANYLAAGSRTCGAVREELLAMLRRQQTEAGVSIYETLVDGHRTYLGRPIPDDAPPRPDEYAVWDEEAQRWTR